MAAKKPLLTLIVLTNNEELHLKRCLNSAKGIAGQVIIVDSGSTDETLAIARSAKAEIYHHEFKNQAEQFNWALDNCDIRGEWVLRLDADEYLTPELMREIPEGVQTVAKGVNGFYMKRRVIFMGRWIRYGGYYPRWFLRIFRKGKGRSEPREMDEHIVLLEGEASRLESDFVDENLRDLNFFTEKHNGFYMRLPLFLRAWWYFIWRFFFRGGFLDGIPGIIFHFLQGFWYRFLIDAKIYEARRKKIENRK